MKIYDFKQNIKKSELEEVSKALSSGKIAVFPTETVYGIGANALDEKAVDKIFKAKKRPQDNPLIVHICDYEMLENITCDISDLERSIMEKFWPSPLSIILHKNNIIPQNVSCGLDTIGVRMPENEIAQNLIKMAGVPIAAPSANISGRPSGTDISDIIDELEDNVDYIIDGGISKIGVESTVVKVVDGIVKILRPGKITKEDFLENGFNAVYDEKIFKIVGKDEKVESPGMKHRHYAPKTKTILVHSKEQSEITKKITQIIVENVDKKVGIICYSENALEYERKFKNINKNISVFDIGKKSDIDSVSKKVFKVLRNIDKDKLDFCVFEWEEKDGLAVAIFNRILRACEGNTIKV